MDVCGRGSTTLVRTRRQGDQGRPAPGGGSGHHVAVGITDHPRCAEIDAHVRRYAEEHSRSGLATPARPAELWNGCVGMVETTAACVGHHFLGAE
jgi:hypothetical protein